jgi:murein DD-endopeptidase MepM/ murein hydrolase activator NlpD
VAALVAGVCLPAIALPSSSAASSVGAVSSPGRTQAAPILINQPTSGTTAPLARDQFSATSEAQLRAITAMSQVVGYTVNNNGPIRWPFPTAVPMGDRFGARGGSHEGTDFLPGNGNPIFATANGVVSVSEYSGALGQHVEIVHSIAGKTFTSVYGHMQAGSSPLRVGQTVAEGAIVGLVGSTGESSGPHLHFQIDINGVPVDSFVWLQANT